MLDEAVTVLDDPPPPGSARGQRFVCGAEAPSWTRCSEVSFSDGNEIKNRTKGETGERGRRRGQDFTFTRL